VRSLWQELAARIRSEVSDLDRVAHRVERFWRGAKQAGPDNDAFAGFLDNLAQPDGDV